jgi:hypothetical protein
MKNLLTSSEDPRGKNRAIPQYLNLFYEACQSIGISLYNYRDIKAQIDANLQVKESGFTPPMIAGSEALVSERISMLNEIEKFLLANSSDNILGFSSLNIF